MKNPPHLFVLGSILLLSSSVAAFHHVAPTTPTARPLMKLLDEKRMKVSTPTTISKARQNNKLFRLSMVSGNEDIFEGGKDFFDNDDDEENTTNDNNDDTLGARSSSDDSSPQTFLEQDELGERFEFEPHVPKLNIVTLSGRVGNVPEPRYFDDGKVVLNLGLAVKRKYHPLERKVKKIQYGQEETDWFTLELWGRDAEFASRFVDKGSRIGITGSLAIDSWFDKDTGEYRRKPKIVVKHLDVLETKAEAELRRRNRENYSNGGGGGNYYNKQNEENDYDDGGPSSAGTGGFFD